jgi:fibronectin-binding autotransporter adhesin
MSLGVIPLSTGAQRFMTTTGNSHLVLTFASSGTGIGYTVNTGRLVVNNAAGTFALGAPTTLAAGTELVLTQPATANFTAAITGAGLVRKTGAGPSTFSGTNTYTGGTLVQNGILTYATDFTMSGSNGFTLTNAASPVRGIDYGATTSSAGTLTNGGGGVWTGTQGDATFTFTESTGDLAVSIVPEPTSCLALASGLGLSGLLLRRRRQSG